MHRDGAFLFACSVIACGGRSLSTGESDERRQLEPAPSPRDEPAGSVCTAERCSDDNASGAGYAGSEGSAGAANTSAGAGGAANTSAGAGGVASGSAGLGGTRPYEPYPGGSGAPPIGGNGGSNSVDPEFPSLSRYLPGATALVSDPLRTRFYVAMGTSAPSFPDSIVTFDAALAHVIGTISVGANPDTLAISDDGTTLWAGLHDNSSLVKLDVQGDTPVLLAAHPLPALAPEEFAPRPHVAGPMVVLPGTTSSLAVTLHIDNLSPSLVGVVVLDDGVPRPARVPGGRGPARLTRGPNPYLMGFNNMDGAFGVYTIEVTADGLHEAEHRASWPGSKRTSFTTRVTSLAPMAPSSTCRTRRPHSAPATCPHGVPWCQELRTVWPGCWRVPSRTPIQRCSHWSL